LFVNLSNTFQRWAALPHSLFDLQERIAAMQSAVLTDVIKSADPSQHG
jgi:hypothetical protein